jgi:hypothetical protein
MLDDAHDQVLVAFLTSRMLHKVYQQSWIESCLCIATSRAILVSINKLMQPSQGGENAYAFSGRCRHASLGRARPLAAAAMVRARPPLAGTWPPAGPG